VSLALRYLKGQRTMRAAPFRGQPLYKSKADAAAVLRHFSGEDFGTDAVKWGAWLRKNRWVYTSFRAQHRP
jgi:hypothetical protein